MEKGQVWERRATKELNAWALLEPDWINPRHLLRFLLARNRRGGNPQTGFGYRQHSRCQPRSHWSWTRFTLLWLTAFLVVCVHVQGFHTAGYRCLDKQNQGSDAEVPGHSLQAAAALKRVRRSWAGGSAQIFRGGPGRGSYISWSSRNFMVQKSASRLVTVAAETIPGAAGDTTCPRHRLHWSWWGISLMPVCWWWVTWGPLWL